MPRPAGLSFIFGNSIRTTCAWPLRRAAPGVAALATGDAAARCVPPRASHSTRLPPACPCHADENVIFLFLAHPYDVGDSLFLDK